LAMSSMLALPGRLLVGTTPAEVYARVQNIQ